MALSGSNLLLSSSLQRHTCVLEKDSTLQTQRLTGQRQVAQSAGSAYSTVWKPATKCTFKGSWSLGFNTCSTSDRHAGRIHRRHSASAVRSPKTLNNPGEARRFVKSEAAQPARPYGKVLSRQTDSLQRSLFEDGKEQLGAEEDVLGAWRAEIFGASTSSGNSSSSPLAQSSGGVSADALGETPGKGSELERGSLGAIEVESKSNTGPGSQGSAIGEDSDALTRKTALAASLLKGDDLAADVMKGPPAREVLGGLKTPPWKGKAQKKETEGPVSDDGSVWRQERLQRYQENKARLQASRAAESSGRGPREDMARVRKSRGLEAGRKHSQLGHVTVARAPMLAEFSGDVHEAIKRAVSEETGDEKEEVRIVEKIDHSEAFERGGQLFEAEAAARTPSLLKAALVATSVAELRQVIEAATSDVLDAENGSVLVRELSWAGKVDLAKYVYQMLCDSGNEPSASASHELVVAAHRKGDYRLTMKVFAMSRVRGVTPKRTTCMAAIESCHRLGKWREAKAVFSDMGRCGLEPDTLAYNALLMALGGARETREVQELWRKMMSAGVQPNQQTYGLLISTFTKADAVDDALEIYERLTKEGFQPTGLMYEGLVVLLSRAKRDRMALNFYQEMRLSGFVLSPRGHAVLLSALAKGWVLDWESALEVYANMKADSIPLDIHHLTALLKVLALSRQTDAALETWKEFLDAGVQPDLSCYNSIIGALRVVYDYDRALNLFWQMKDSGICPDQETYGNLLWACTEPALSKTALKIFEDMKESGVKPNTHAFTALFTVMGRAGEWQTALELWKEMRNLGIKPRTKTYNAMIGCLGRCRKAELMLKAHKQMLDEGIQPDDTTRHFLGKFGPPGTSQSSQPWGRGNLMGQRIELKHYARGDELGAEIAKEAAPPEQLYRRPGVLHAVKRDDKGWVRPDRERKLAEERRRLELAQAEETSGQEEDELEWVSGNEEEGLHNERRGCHPSAERGSINGATGWKGGRDRTSKQDGNVGRPASVTQNGGFKVDGQDIMKTKGLEKELASRQGGKKEKETKNEDDVPLWQII